MKIHHIAIWVLDLEEMKNFYMKYFNAKPGKQYYNPKKDLKSYFMEFDGGCKLEIMTNPHVFNTAIIDLKQLAGFTHLSISVGSKKEVDRLTEKLRGDGFVVEGEPRTTGDGYYESVVLDPENNTIEITE